MWISFNPHEEADPTYQRFVLKPPPDAAVVEINYDDNPWFPDVLRREMGIAAASISTPAMHIWRGKPRKIQRRRDFCGQSAC